MARGEVVSSAKSQYPSHKGERHVGATTEGRDGRAHEQLRVIRKLDLPLLSYMRCVRSSVARFCGG